MSVTYRDTGITGIAYHGTNITEGYYRSTQVFSSSSSELILESFNLATNISVIPRPYGNYDNPYTNNDPNASAPAEEAIEYINLGNVSSYDGVTFNWNNEGSFLAYGEMYGDVSIVDSENVEVEGSKIRLFTVPEGFGYKTLDLSSLSGVYKIKVHLYAKSFSNYSGYSARTVITMTDIKGVIGGIVPPSGTKVTDDFTIESHIASPPPYDENGYNYSWSGGTDTDEVVIDLGDVTSYNELSFEWLSSIDDMGTGIAYGGEAKASYTFNSASTYMFDLTEWGNHFNNGRVVIDLSGVTGQKSITIRTVAYANNAYRAYGTTTRLTINNMYIY